jgi:hypothetical protein
VQVLKGELILKKANYIILGVAALILAVTVLLILVGGPQGIMGSVMGGRAVPDDLDTAETRLSDQGIFKVSITSSIDPVPVNQIHTWTVHVENAAGQILEQAEITVDGGMPQHGHGLPTKPQVTQNLGEGDYLVEGLKFNMPGWWEVTFHITANGQSDSVTFNPILK